MVFSNQQSTTNLHHILRPAWDQDLRSHKLLIMLTFKASQGCRLDVVHLVESIKSKSYEVT